MLTIDKLNEYGANTAEGVARCMGNEALYLRLASTVADQAEFAKLNDSIASGDLGSAFEAAHALKGVLANLSITPLYEKVCEITELLRARTDTDYSPLLSEIGSLKDELKRLIDSE